MRGRPHVTTSPTRLELTAAGRADLARVRAHVAGLCAAAGVERAACEALVLATDEVCTNVLLHAYRNLPGPLSVDVVTTRAACASEGVRVVVTIIDAGPPFDPTVDARAVQRDAPFDALPIGGLGWHLVRQSVDAVRYARTAGRNVVTLECRLPSPPSPWTSPSRS